jgi:hypothetical protein
VLAGAGDLRDRVGEALMLSNLGQMVRNMPNDSYLRRRLDGAFIGSANLGTTGYSAIRHSPDGALADMMQWVTVNKTKATAPTA